MADSYEVIIAASERAAWTIDEVIPPNQPLDYSKRFLPAALVGADALAFLSPYERLRLNQVRGNAYAHLFQFVEESIVATCVQHVQAQVFGDETSLRAMLRFAEEEVKHQLLFRRFLALFRRGFGSPCAGVAAQQAVAGVILSKTPMAVMLITLHLEVMTQQHFVQCIADADELDPTVKRMLKSHWAEESQHAKLDALTLRSLAATSTVELRAQAVRDYLELVDALLAVLGQQAELDVSNLEAAVGRTFHEDQREELLESQQASYRRTFIVWGITNPAFVETIKDVFPEDAARISRRASELN